MLGIRVEMLSARTADVLGLGEYMVANFLVVEGESVLKDPFPCCQVSRVCFHVGKVATGSLSKVLRLQPCC